MELGEYMEPRVDGSRGNLLAVVKAVEVVYSKWL
eukprot:gene8409-10205_t